jgi:hypothetical protein
MGLAGTDRLSGSHSAVKWSSYVGVYIFLCSTATLLILGPISNTLGKLLGFPAVLSELLLAVPVSLIGAAVWWALTERREAYSYRIGAATGVVTALATVLFWVFVYSIIWGSLVVLAGGVLIGFVLAVVAPVAVVIGVTAMYVRRELGDGLAENNEAPVS